MNRAIIGKFFSKFGVMKPTVDFLNERFDSFNAQIFGSRLPKVPISLSDSRRTLGQCIKRSVGNKPDRFEIRISTSIDLNIHEVEDVLIHEMIHLFIGYNGLTDTAPHGAAFRGIMAAINATHGRRLSVTARLTDEQRESAISEKRKWHLIAAIRFDDGRCGVKVLPRTSDKIAAFCRAVRASQGVTRLDLYLHDDPFFNRYPNSVALRYHMIDSDELDAHLAGARPLRL